MKKLREFKIEAVEEEHYCVTFYGLTGSDSLLFLEGEDFKVNNTLLYRVDWHNSEPEANSGVVTHETDWITSNHSSKISELKNLETKELQFHSLNIEFKSGKLDFYDGDFSLYHTDLEKLWNIVKDILESHNINCADEIILYSLKNLATIPIYRFKDASPFITSEELEYIISQRDELVKVCYCGNCISSVADRVEFKPDIIPSINKFVQSFKDSPPIPLLNLEDSHWILFDDGESDTKFSLDPEGVLCTNRDPGEIIEGKWHHTLDYKVTLEFDNR